MLQYSIPRDRGLKRFLFVQLRKAYAKQAEEIRNLKNQLASSDKRVHELEAEVAQLQKQLQCA